MLTLFRAYDPELGRWLSADPIGEAGGLNLYGYVGGNPVNYRDPLGLEIAGGEEISEYVELGVGVIGEGLTAAGDFMDNLYNWAGPGTWGKKPNPNMICGTPPLIGPGGAAKFPATARGGFRLVTVYGEKYGIYLKEIPGKAGGQARAVYTKCKNASGETIRLFKDTFDKAGRFWERKHKMPNFPNPGRPK